MPITTAVIQGRELPMNMNIDTTQALTAQPQPTVEAIPAEWTDERDEPFFRITAALFSPEFTLGASVLLASYDDENA